MKSVRIRTLVSLLILTPLGFASKLYPGPGRFWFNNYFAGVLYEIFWCLVILLVFPKAGIRKTVSFVFILTCILEVMQLWHAPLLETIRSAFIGRALIGTTFSAWDFLYYAAGCILGAVWMRFLKK